MHRVNLVRTPPWTSGEVRSLITRHLVYTCVVVSMSLAGAFVGGSWAQCLSVQEGADQSKAIEQVSRCRTELDDLQRMSRWLSESKSSRNHLSQALQAFQNSMPTDVWLGELAVSEGQIEIVGLARSESSISALLKGLSGSSDITHPRLESSQVAPASSSDVREFRMSAVLRAPVCAVEDDCV